MSWYGSGSPPFFPATSETRSATRSSTSSRKRDIDAGLIHGVQAIERALESVSVGHKRRAAGGMRIRLIGPLHGNVAGGHSTMGTFFLIILGIFGVFCFSGSWAACLAASAGAGYPNQMGGMGMRGPGMGPGGRGITAVRATVAEAAASSRECSAASAGHSRVTGSTISFRPAGGMNSADAYIGRRLPDA